MSTPCSLMDLGSPVDPASLEKSDSVDHPVAPGKFVDDHVAKVAKKLSCHFCSKHFNLDDLQPMLLSCKHVICKECASKIRKKRATIFCFEACNTPTYVWGRTVEGMPQPEDMMDWLYFTTPLGHKGPIHLPSQLNCARGAVEPAATTDQVASDGSEPAVTTMILDCKTRDPASAGFGVDQSLNRTPPLKVKKGEKSMILARLTKGEGPSGNEGTVKTPPKPRRLSRFPAAPLMKPSAVPAGCLYADEDPDE